MELLLFGATGICSLRRFQHAEGTENSDACKRCFHKSSSLSLRFLIIRQKWKDTAIMLSSIDGSIYLWSYEIFHFPSLITRALAVKMFWPVYHALEYSMLPLEA